MGMGGLVEKKGGKPVQADESGDPSEAGPSHRPGLKQTFSNWGGFKRDGAAEGKKKAIETSDSNEPEEDDRQIRFTIGGVGRRMTKDDFLKEVQNLDSRTRKEVVEQSNASPAVKIAAKQGVPTIQEPEPEPTPTRSQPQQKEKPVPDPRAESSTSSSSSGKSPARPPTEQPSRGRSGTVGSGDQPSTQEPETAAERRRRLAAFATVHDDNDVDETPAERRRRQAALGRADEDSDSDDDNTPRVPPAGRRGIRFADDARPKA